MIDKARLTNLLSRLSRFPHFPLALLPTPVQPLKNLARSINAPELWMKRDDLSGLEGGGNKTRKLEFLVGDALARGADMLVTVGAIQSNHTRQTAAAAAKAGLKCALLHCAWTQDAGPHYRTIGNVLISHIIGAELYLDETERPIEDQGPLGEFIEQLKGRGHTPYLIPGGASEHPLGCLGYIKCAAEIAVQSEYQGFAFDHLVHCTGSSSTQAGLLAGFAALEINTHLIGIADDDETELKKARVLTLANEALQLLELDQRIQEQTVDVIACDPKPYGVPSQQVIRSIELMARNEGVVADPVYEGRAIHGLIQLVQERRFAQSDRVLLMHLGGSPAIHAYAEHFGSPQLTEFEPSSARTPG